ncbi:MAG TPA: hypothetical protein PLK99_06550, partial [Burkholderiales bacterium]|nr:hypothetical protein [Burkholderiales bacterium]
PPTPDSSQPHIADEVREEVIKHYFAAMTHAETTELKQYWCARMNEQVRARSAAVVERMERERGLR